MEPFIYQEQVGIPFFLLEPWINEFPHLQAGFSAKKRKKSWNESNYALHVNGDPKEVIQNRKQLLKHLPFTFDMWTCGNQVHGTTISFVTEEAKGSGRRTQESAIPDTDGLLTFEDNVLLTSFYADCVPLFFYSPDQDLIGIAHAGWKGTVHGIGSKMIEQMVEQGAERSQIRVAIAPSIGPCCYEVDDRVISPLKKQFPLLTDQKQVVHESSSNGRYYLDLKKANALLLQRSGISPSLICQSEWCTHCEDQLFHSHRRDQGNTGRMVAWIGKR